MNIEKEQIEEYLQLSVELVVDNVENFMETITMPTAKSIRDSFLISLGFTAVSVFCEYIDILCFITWDEAVVCNIILLILTLIDSGTRSAIKGNIKKLKDVAASARNRSKETIIEQEEITDEPTGSDTAY